MENKGVKFEEGQRTSSSFMVCKEVNGTPAYMCEAGQCCEETGCCTYYFELWWFWMLWMLIVLFSCCCAYRHRRNKLRLQQQQRETNLTSYQRACSSTGPALDLSVLTAIKLPSYEEVEAQSSTPPPPYSAVLALSSSHSSGNCTSCSCDSYSLSSHCSTSFSVQVTDEMLTSEATTPSEPGDTHMTMPFPGPCPSLLPLSGLALALPATLLLRQESGTTIPENTVSSSIHTMLQAEGQKSSPKRPERSSQEDLKENHFRHRSLTGDSGIEVCRCRVSCEQEDEKNGNSGRGGGVVAEDAELPHDRADCLLRAQSNHSQYGPETASQRAIIESS